MELVGEVGETSERETLSGDFCRSSPFLIGANPSWGSGSAGRLAPNASLVASIGSRREDRLLQLLSDLNCRPMLRLVYLTKYCSHHNVSGIRSVPLASEVAASDDACGRYSHTRQRCHEYDSECPWRQAYQSLNSIQLTPRVG